MNGTIEERVDIIEQWLGITEETIPGGDMPTLRWRAKIQVNCRRIELCIYPDPILAESAYTAAAKWYFGDYAFINPMTVEQAAVLSDAAKDGGE